MGQGFGYKRPIPLTRALVLGDGVAWTIHDLIPTPLCCLIAIDWYGQYWSIVFPVECPPRVIEAHLSTGFIERWKKT